MISGSRFFKSVFRRPKRWRGKRCNKLQCAADLLELRQLLSAVTVQFGASRDTTIYQTDPDASNGAGEFILVGGGTHGLVQFDVGGIPDGSTIIDAVLTLNAAHSSIGGGTVAAHPISAAWGESESNASGDESVGAPAREFDATWLYSQYDGQLWSTPGGDYGSSSASTAIDGVGAYELAGGGLIDDVQGWLDDAAANFGWLIEASGGAVASFISKDSPDASLAPLLEVTYEGPPAIVEGRIWNDVNADGVQPDPALAALDLDIVAGNNYFNAFGGREYWFRSGENDKWYFLTSDGTLTEWSGTGGSLDGSVVTLLDASLYYNKPDLVTRAASGELEPWLNGWTVELLDGNGVVISTTQTEGRDLDLDGTVDAVTEGGWYTFDVTLGATYSVRQVVPDGWMEGARIEFDISSATARLVNELKLGFRNSYYEDFGGRGEKWVLSPDSGWHYITPEGGLFRWDGEAVTESSPLNGTLVATVGSAYFDDPSLLFDGQYSDSPSGSDTGSVIKRVDFGNYETNEISGRVWLDFFGNSVRDNLTLSPEYLKLFPLEVLSEDHEWFYDYEHDDWYIIDPDGLANYWGPHQDEEGGPFDRPGTDPQMREFIETEIEPWINRRSVQLIDQNGNVVATTETKNVDVNGDGSIQFETERGWYIFEDVRPGEYTVRTAPEEGWTQTAPLTTEQTTAIVLDLQLDLRSTVSDFLNWGGANERWLMDANNLWYYILENGELYEWEVGSGGAQGLKGTLVGQLTSAFYHDLTFLTDPDAESVSVSVKSGVKGADVLFGNHKLLDEVITSLE
ncbi:MAG: DNRLRE domain-containing protein [Fuerstiella sp.]|nr:DNRLRE domain-containing protein [Fuerstiella sp.]